MALPAACWVAVAALLHCCLPLRVAEELPRGTLTPSLPRAAGGSHGHHLEVGSRPLAVPGQALLSWRGEAHPDHHIKPEGEFALECFVCQGWVPGGVTVSQARAIKGMNNSLLREGWWHSSLLLLLLLFQQLLLFHKGKQTRDNLLLV